MNTNPTCHGTAGVDSKQREVAASPSVFGAKGDKSNGVESKNPIKTWTKKRTLPA